MPISDPKMQKQHQKLFDYLSRLGIVNLEIHANGEGDNGDIEHILFGIPAIDAEQHSVSYPYLDYDKTEKILSRKFMQATIETAIKTIGYQLLDDGRAPDWINAEGGHVEISIDLSVNPAVAKANYQERVIDLIPAADFSYNAISGAALDKNPAHPSSEIGYQLQYEYLLLQSDDDDNPWVEIAASDDEDTK